MTRHVVPDDVPAGRADVVLAAVLAVSRSRAAAMIRGGGVRRDGQPLRPADPLASGDEVDVVEEASAPDVRRAPPPLPPVRYRDDHLLVLAKPAGLVVHPGPGHATGTLVDALVAAGIPLPTRGDPARRGIVHRLDRDTSGLLVVACTDDAHDGLVDALRRRTVSRRYLALVEGRLPADQGRVDAPVGRDPRDRQRFAAVEGGKPAVTHWKVRRTAVVDTIHTALVACRLETGRTHQIRVHMAFAGAPVAGDLRYGASSRLAELVGLSRPFLHATALAFAHPVTGEQVALEEALPPDLFAALDRVGIAEGDAQP